MNLRMDRLEMISISLRIIIHKIIFWLKLNRVIQDDQIIKFSKVIKVIIKWTIHNDKIKFIFVSKANNLIFVLLSRINVVAKIVVRTRLWFFIIKNGTHYFPFLTFTAFPLLVLNFVSLQAKRKFVWHHTFCCLLSVVILDHQV